MPAFVLFYGSQTVARFDVVADCSRSEARFVGHVALHNADARELSDDQDVEVVHMGPPLTIDRRINVRAAGCIPLMTDEIKEVAYWISEIADEYRRERVDGRQQYVIHPPWKDENDPNTGVRRYRRFSCAGFVLDAHRQVDIHLLVFDEHALPEVDKQTLGLAYPNVKFRHLYRFGLHGDGPWRIVLAGYVLHALNRTSEEIRREPYQARAGDERF